MSSAEPHLILLAHGSRDARWRAPFEAFAQQAQKAFGGQQVSLAYMEMATPTLADVAQVLYRQGVRRAKLLPLFMAQGGHLSHDVPRQVEALAQQFPGFELEILPPVGEDPRVVQAMLAVVAEALG